MSQFAVIIRTRGYFNAYRPFVAEVSRITPKFVFTKTNFQSENRYGKTEIVFRLFDTKQAAVDLLTDMRRVCMIDRAEAASRAALEAERRATQAVQAIVAPWTRR